MNNYYYHGLNGDSVVYSPKESIVVALKRLESILKNGGILSRNRLKRLNTFFNHSAVYNTDDYISICTNNIKEDEFLGKNEGFDSAYNKYTKDTISIIISSDIDNDCEFRSSGYDFLPGERQVKDMIDSSYFVGIKVSFRNEELTMVVAEMVNELLMKYNMDLPIYDENFYVLTSKCVK